MTESYLTEFKLGLEKQFPGETFISFKELAAEMAKNNKLECSYDSIVLLQRAVDVGISIGHKQKKEEILESLKVFWKRLDA